MKNKTESRSVGKRLNGYNYVLSNVHCIAQAIQKIAQLWRSVSKIYNKNKQVISTSTYWELKCSMIISTADHKTAYFDNINIEQLVVLHYLPPVLSHSYIATHKFTYLESGSFLDGLVNDFPYLYAHAIRPL